MLNTEEFQAFGGIWYLSHNLEVVSSNLAPATFSNYRRNKHLSYLPAVGSAA